MREKRIAGRLLSKVYQKEEGRRRGMKCRKEAYKQSACRLPKTGSVSKLNGRWTEKVQGKETE